MSEEIEFPKGLMYKAPRQGAPDFIKGQISIKIDELIPYLKEKAVVGNWLNLDVKTSKKGKDYISVNNWKPKNGGSNANDSAGNMSANDFANEGFSEIKEENGEVPF